MDNVESSDVDLDVVSEPIALEGLAKEAARQLRTRLGEQASDRRQRADHANQDDAADFAVLCERGSGGSFDATSQQHSG